MTKTDPNHGADCWEQCFVKITPKTVDTFSFRKKPCRFETPILAQDAKVLSKQECPFREYCDVIDGLKWGTHPNEYNLKEVLKDAYSEQLKNTLSEPSTSIVIRSEQQFHGQDLRRFALRRHLYEVVQSGGDDGRFGPGCTDLTPNDRLGEYVGFVDLREHYNESPLAMGMLVIPSWIREDPSIFVIQGYYSPLFGTQSFRSTVYCMQDPNTTGAMCAHMCAIMAAGMLSDRGAKIRGSFNLTYLGWTLQWEVKVMLTKLLLNPSKLAQQAPLKRFNIGAMSNEQICLALRESNVEAKPVTIKTGGIAGDRKATRLIEAYVYARYPVILSVDAAKWANDDAAKPNAHAVVIVGIRRGSERNGEVTDFIVHDPGSGPFHRSPVATCLTAARQAHTRPKGQPKAPWRPGNRIQMVLTACGSIRRHASDCLGWLGDRESESGNLLNRKHTRNPDPHFVPYEDAEAGTDYRIRLLNRNTVAGFLKSYLDAKDCRQVEMVMNKFPIGARFWCIVGLRTSKRSWLSRLFRRSGNHEMLELHDLWLFDAARPPGDPPSAMFHREPDGRYKPLGPIDRSRSSIDAAGETDSTSAPNPRFAIKLLPRDGFSADALRANPLLLPAVMTSSSERSLHDLFSEVHQISGATGFDLMLGRRADLHDCHIAKACEKYDRLSQIVADHDLFKALSKHLREVVKKATLPAAGTHDRIESRQIKGFHVPALATYFPDVTSMDQDRRQTAVRAIANSIRLALDIQEDCDLKSPPVIEIVCGTVLDQGKEDKQWDLYNWKFKCRRLLDSLRLAITQVLEERKDVPFAIALELEPGETYVLNGLEPMKYIAGMLRPVTSTSQKPDPLIGRVGFNIDVAHMRIARITATDLLPFQDLIVHTHCSDHPRIHTHDQVVGSWTNLMTTDGGYQDYLRLLINRAITVRTGKGGPLPFTGSVAIELEGCNRIMAVHDSLSRLKRAIYLAQH